VYMMCLKCANIAKLDPALRRGGRFGTEINMGVPNETMREQILRALTRHTPVSVDIDFASLAKKTPGFVGADLRDLVDKAGEWSMDQFRQALKRQAVEAQIEMEVDAGTSDAIQSIQLLIRRAKNKNAERPAGFETGDLSMQAFLEVLPDIQPSSKREGFATIPDTTWSDIGALQDVSCPLNIARRNLRTVAMLPNMPNSVSEADEVSLGTLITFIADLVTRYERHWKWLLFNPYKIRNATRMLVYQLLQGYYSSDLQDVVRHYLRKQSLGRVRQISSVSKVPSY
jgi:hypothetical protein